MSEKGKRGRESFIDSTGRVGIDAMGNATASSFSNRWIGIPRFEPTCRSAIIFEKPADYFAFEQILKEV